MNVIAMRGKIQKAIDKMPTEIALNRYILRSDGMGGFIRSQYPTEVAIFNALLDNSSHSISSLSKSTSDPATTVYGKTNKLYAVYSDNFEILVDDFFEIAGTKYIIKNAVDILNLNIYYECDLEDTKKVVATR